MKFDFRCLFDLGGGSLAYLFFIYVHINSGHLVLEFFDSFHDFLYCFIESFLYEAWVIILEIKEVPRMETIGIMR